MAPETRPPLLLSSSSPSLLQLKEHFRPFKQSQLFLRHQNQLLHTISEGDDRSEDASSELSTAATEQVVDLDDPEELWSRAHLP